MQDGGFSTLGKIIKQKVFHFENVEAMKDCLTLIPGDVVQTLGYHEENDGGEGLYEIVNDSSLEDDGGIIHELDNKLKAKLIIKNDTVNVKQFGAKGDGTTDDTNVFANVISKVNNIYIPNGTYLISSTLTLKSNINIFGSRMVILKQKNNSNINNIFYGTNLSNIRLSNLNLDLNIENQSYSNRSNSGRGILFTSCDLINIDNVNTDKIYGSFIYIVDSTNGEIKNSTIKDPDGAYNGYGIYLVRSQHFKVNNCKFYGVREYGTSLSSYGVQAKDSGLDIIVEKCLFNKMQCILDGSESSNTPSHLGTSLKIINNIFIDTTGDTTIRYCNYGIIANNISRGSGDFGISVGDSQYVEIVNNIVEGSNTVGIGVRKSPHCIVLGNLIKDPCSNFRGISLVENQRVGIYVLGDSRRCNICNNTIIDTKTETSKMYSGIRVEDTSNGVVGDDESFAVICNNTVYGASQLSNQIYAPSTKNIKANNLLQ